MTPPRPRAPRRPSIAYRIVVARRAGLTVTGIAPDGTVLTAAPATAQPAPESVGDEAECDRLFGTG